MTVELLSEELFCWSSILEEFDNNWDATLMQESAGFTPALFIFSRELRTSTELVFRRALTRVHADEDKGYSKIPAAGSP
ncbi:hypothetical protein AOLI_G00013250 [Acnodon oligacanthus]